MDILELGAQLLADKQGMQLDAESVKSALSGLLGDGSGNIDLAGLASKMTANGDLADVLNSWLGDGANAGISADTVLGLLGEDSIAAFANQLGTDTGTAAAGLADAIPQMMDKASSGGSLLDSAGGIDGLIGAAKSFLS
jgi:uncharacterized protein YidB (DUF937 family)